jgi:hypothetical protein
MSVLRMPTARQYDSHRITAKTIDWRIDFFHQHNANPSNHCVPMNVTLAN